MRYDFPINQGYSDLLELLTKKGKDYFVWSSNVDGCFSRSGFDEKKLYTPQGDFSFLQCRPDPCSKAVFSTRKVLDQVLPMVLPNGELPLESVPKCPNCKKTKLFANVRGGDWFIHEHLNPQQDRLLAWLNEIEERSLRLVIMEVGAGFNTPTVTRFPMEAITRTYANAKLIRINPSDPHVPLDLLNALPVRYGWQFLSTMNLHRDESLLNVDFENAVKEHEQARLKEIDDVTRQAGNKRVDLSGGIKPRMHFLFLQSLRR